MFKKTLTIISVVVLILITTACGAQKTGAETKGFIGISMPTKSSERWVNDGENMKKLFEDLGYSTDLQYAEDIIENQTAQIENMITKGVDILVIAPIYERSGLTGVLERAHNNGIKIISYDRLIQHSEYVDYYATFDNFKVGELQGQYIEEKLELKNSEGPFNIEIFAGSPDDNNAYFFFDGAMSVLQPYIDSGKLVVRSKQTKFSQGATLRWDGALAQSRMDNLLSAYYSTEQIDAVLSPYDGISIGVISSLRGVGYGSKDKPMPIITGQDAELASIKAIINGRQTQTIFKDTRELAKKAVEMARALLNEEEAEVNDVETYNNGKKIVPAYLLKPVSVDIDNYQSVLVDTNYYTKEQLGQ